MLFVKNGDVFIHPNKCIIAHCCNDLGTWGSGFVLEIDKHSLKPRESYKRWHEDKNNEKDCSFSLGNVMLVPINEKQTIANIIGQAGYGFGRHVRYQEIKKAMISIANEIDNTELKVDIVSPLLGAGLAGGTIKETYDIVYDIFSKSNINYYLYAFSNKDYQELLTIKEQND